MRITCKDGFTFGMITGPNTYSGQGSAEIGFPSKPDSLLTPYQEKTYPDDMATECIYPYVPLHVIAQLLTKHNAQQKPS